MEGNTVQRNEDNIPTVGGKTAEEWDVMADEASADGEFGLTERYRSLANEVR